MRISDWSSDVCSSDLRHRHRDAMIEVRGGVCVSGQGRAAAALDREPVLEFLDSRTGGTQRGCHHRSEEHTSELQSLMRTSYAVFCLHKKKIRFDFPGCAAKTSATKTIPHLILISLLTLC